MIRPTGNNVLVRRKRHRDEVMVGGIHIPDTGLGTVGECVVLDVGPGKWYPVLDDDGEPTHEWVRTGSSTQAYLAVYRRQELQVKTDDRVMIGTMLGGTRVWPVHLPLPGNTQRARVKYDFVMCSEEAWLTVSDTGRRDEHGHVDPDVDDIRLIDEAHIMCVLEDES